MSTPASQHVVIIGGSYAGLCSAVAFQANGWSTTVLERSIETRRYGGGVVVQRRMGDYIESYGMASPGISSVPARMRVRYQPDGSSLRLPETARSYAAWDVLLREFEMIVGEQNIFRGHNVVDFRQDDNSGNVILADGTELSGDLIIAADGLGSSFRKILLPGSKPSYSGYVAWRGTVDKVDIPKKIRTDCVDTFCTYTGDRTNFVAYEIPGSDGSVGIERRRINWVWYVNVDGGENLKSLLVGNSGRKKKATLSRGEVRQDTIQQMLRNARSSLPAKFAAIIESTPEPFVQTIQDYQSPRLVFGRVAMIGDAACLIRPHLGEGTEKAFEDAISLADAVCESRILSEGRMRAWELVRLKAHHIMATKAKVVARRCGLG